MRWPSRTIGDSSVRIGGARIRSADTRRSIAWRPVHARGTCRLIGGPLGAIARSQRPHRVLVPADAVATVVRRNGRAVVVAGRATRSRGTAVAASGRNSLSRWQYGTVI